MQDIHAQIYPPLRSELCVSSAQGVYVFDEQSGRKYIDLSGAAGMAVTGYGHTRIKEVLTGQAEKLIIAPQKYRTEESEKLLEKISSLLPYSFDLVIPSVTGSEAVENAMQIAVNHTGRKKFLSIQDAYHGHTFASGSLGEADYSFDIIPENFSSIDHPRTEKEVGEAIDAIEYLLDKDNYAAFILEGVITNAGYFMPPSAFYHRLRDLCSRKGVLLVFDEVLTGFGRTGEMFSFQHHGITPDLICLSKGLSSGYVPIAAVAARRDLVHGYDTFATFAWSPLACAVTSANIDVILEENLVANSRDLGKYALFLLNKYLGKCPRVKAIRGEGLGIALELNDQEKAMDIHAKCLEAGVILFKNPYRNILFIQPPLVINKNELTEAIKQVVQVIVDDFRDK